MQSKQLPVSPWKEADGTSGSCAFLACLRNWLLTNVSLRADETQNMHGTWGLQRAKLWFRRHRVWSSMQAFATAPLSRSGQSERGDKLQLPTPPSILTCRSLHTLDCRRRLPTNTEFWMSREVRETPKILARLIEKAEFWKCSTYEASLWRLAQVDV